MLQWLVCWRHRYLAGCYWYLQPAFHARDALALHDDGGCLLYTSTVYLHVGLAKSWILQYSLPSAGDAAAAGNISRLEAPWPYNIVRPNLSPDTVNADALMIHGFVNQAGRFELLAVAFPPQFEQAQFVLDALRQWQFRPAAQNGQSERVEVVLIIPEEVE